jgi:hypothetical protein
MSCLSNYRQPTVYDDATATNIEAAFVDVAETYEHEGAQVAARRLRYLADQVEAEAQEKGRR